MLTCSIVFPKEADLMYFLKLKQACVECKKKVYFIIYKIIINMFYYIKKKIILRWRSFHNTSSDALRHMISYVSWGHRVFWLLKHHTPAPGRPSWSWPDPDSLVTAIWRPFQLPPCRLLHPVLPGDCKLQNDLLPGCWQEDHVWPQCGWCVIDNKMGHRILFD